MGLSLASTLASLALPYLTRRLVDDALLGRDLRALVTTVGAFALLGVLGFALNVAAGLRYTHVSADILFAMRRDLYRHLQSLSPRYYARTPLGDIVSRINSDIGEIQRVAAETALAWIGSGLYLVGTVAVMLWLDARLFLIGLLALPPSLLALVIYRRRLEAGVTRVRERSADIGSFLIETLLGMRLVVASNAQDRELSRFEAKNDRFVEALLSMRWLTYLAGGLPALLLTLGTAVVFLYGGFRVIAGTVTLGTFAAFMAYQMRLLSPVQGLMGLYAGLATARASLVRVAEVFSVAPEVTSPAEAPPLGRVDGRLTLEGVHLAHDTVPVLAGVDVEVARGETVALVGPSGSGKSTLADLLTRQIDPDAGRVLLDGRDLTTMALSELRAQVLVIDSEPFLFNASIDENVRYARPDASPEDLEDALRAAGLHRIRDRRPDPHGPVGERGRGLSAGERQRVQIARALLARPAVLVLDEATAALDPASQAELWSAYARVLADRTTVIITHRPELARLADRIVLLENGRIRAEGPPSQLEADSAPLRRLFTSR